MDRYLKYENGRGDTNALTSHVFYGCTVCVISIIYSKKINGGEHNGRER